MEVIGKLHAATAYFRGGGGPRYNLNIKLGSKSGRDVLEKKNTGVLIGP